MKLVDRPLYMDKIEKFIDKPVIKVLTGMRRVGKSTLLKIISDQSLNNINENNKIFINLDSFELLHVRNARDLAEHLKPLIYKSQGKLYFSLMRFN